MTNIIICIDGTMNTGGLVNQTNVWKLYSSLPPGQKALYLEGVGSGNEGNWLTRVLGATGGYGADAKRDEAHTWLCENFEPGDEIFIFGFSRGAAIARMLAAKIGENADLWGGVGVKLLGCFDTVEAFGVAGNEINLFKDSHVSPCVKNALHLVAIDERRRAFWPTLMNQRPGIEEIWFAGDHSDVGGSHLHSGLSDNTLGVMMDRVEIHGLEFLPEALSKLNPNPLSPIHENGSPLSEEMRPVGVQVDDKIDPSLPIQVHHSVIERMDRTFYDPANFEWVTYRAVR